MTNLSCNFDDLDSKIEQIRTITVRSQNQISISVRKLIGKSYTSLYTLDSNLDFTLSNQLDNEQDTSR